MQYWTSCLAALLRAMRPSGRRMQFAASYCLTRSSTKNVTLLRWTVKTKSKKLTAYEYLLIMPEKHLTGGDSRTLFRVLPSRPACLTHQDSPVYFPFVGLSSQLSATTTATFSKASPKNVNCRGSNSEWRGEHAAWSEAPSAAVMIADEGGFASWRLS